MVPALGWCKKKMFLLYNVKTTHLCASNAYFQTQTIRIFHFLFLKRGLFSTMYTVSLYIQVWVCVGQYRAQGDHKRVSAPSGAGVTEDWQELTLCWAISPASFSFFFIFLFGCFGFWNRVFSTSLWLSWNLLCDQAALKLSKPSFLCFPGLGLKVWPPRG